MKRKNVSKAIAMAAAAVMLFTGCGGSNAADAPVSGTTDTGPAAQAGGGESSEAAESDSAVASEEAAERGEPTEIRIFYSYDPNTETEASKFLVKEMEKALNIKLIRDEVPKSAYSEKLQLALADGDYPDVFVFDSHEDAALISAVDNGLIIPVNQYVENMENIQKYTYPQAFEAAKIKNDENIYLIPRTTVARADGFAVRSDWMEKVGIDITSDNYSMTPDEFLDMLEKFTTQDPDGDGKDNTYGLQYSASNGMMDVFYGGAFDCLGWQKSDGEFSFMDPQYEIGNENYREALEYNQKVYKYAHPDSVISTEVGINEVGVSSSFAGHVSSRERKVQELVPEAELTYVSGISNKDGVIQSGTSVPGIWGGLAITTACEHPEKVAELVNWLLSEQAWEYSLYGEPGVSYNKNDDGTIEIVEEVYRKNKEMDAGWATSIARRKESVDFFLDLSLPEEELAEVRDWLNVAVDGVVMSLNNGKKPESASDTMFIEADNKLKEVRTKIIMGAADISEYDKALAEWYEKGGREYVEEMNTIIESMQ